MLAAWRGRELRRSFSAVRAPGWFNVLSPTGFHRERVLNP
jgi:hypothetical protein